MSFGCFVGHLQRMASGHIAKGSEFAHLHQQRAVRVLSESHTGFEQNVWPSLACKLLLEVGVATAEEFLQKACLIIRREQNDNGSCFAERRFENRADVGGWLPGHLDYLIPFERFETDRPQKGEHGVPDLVIAPMHDKNSRSSPPSSVRCRRHLTR